MSCTCHINPPCSWCADKYECVECGELKHPSESEPNYYPGTDTYECARCVETDRLARLAKARLTCPHPMCQRSKLPTQFCCAQHWKGLPIQIRSKILQGYKASARLWEQGRDDAEEFWRDGIDTMQRGP